MCRGFFVTDGKYILRQSAIFYFFNNSSAFIAAKITSYGKKFVNLDWETSGKVLSKEDKTNLKEFAKDYKVDRPDQGDLDIR